MIELMKKSSFERMKRIFTVFAVAAAFSATAMADNAKVTIYADQGTQKIHKEIYGQFAEHLGSCIYGGLWVGENSQIPNVNGYRKDVFDALKALQIPVLRWPGGCFADEYHWMDGIGPKENRPKMQNNNWVVPSRTTLSVRTSSSTSARCSAVSHTSAATLVAVLLRSWQSGLSI